MRFLFFYLAFVFCFTLWGCEVKLERESIPLWIGIQLEPDTTCLAQSWQANKQIHATYHPEGWVIEVPIFIPNDDSASIRIPSHEEINLALIRMKTLSVQTCLHFSLQNPFRKKEADISHDTYTRLIDQLLPSLPYSPGKLMFSGFWIQEKAFQEALIEKFPTWKSALPQTSLYIAGRHQSLLSEVIDWEGDYELAVIHDAPPDQVYKPYFRKVNHALSEKAIKHGRHLFVAQSNILGGQKLLLFKNQLRFWDEELELDGLVINSLYCTSSLADSSTRFGLAKDLDLLEYVKSGR